MEKKKITLYNYNELFEKAQWKAHSDFQQNLFKGVYHKYIVSNIFDWLYELTEHNTSFVSWSTGFVERVKINFYMHPDIANLSSKDLLSYIDEHFKPLIELSIPDESKTPHKYVEAFANSLIDRDWNPELHRLKDLIGLCCTDLANEIYDDMLNRDKTYFDNKEAPKHLYFRDGTVVNEEMLN